MFRNNKVERTPHLSLARFTIMRRLLVCLDRGKYARRHLETISKNKNGRGQTVTLFHLLAFVELPQ